MAATDEQWDAAVWHYEVGLELQPDAEAYASLGNIHHYQTGDLATAEAYRQQAIALEPSQPWWHVGLGEVYVTQEKYEQALAELQNAVGLREWGSEGAEVYVAVGRTHHALGHFQNAVQAYQQALMLEPDNGSASEGLEEALARVHGK